MLNRINYPFNIFFSIDILRMMPCHTKIKKTELIPTLQKILDKYFCSFIPPESISTSNTYINNIRTVF